MTAVQARKVVKSPVGRQVFTPDLQLQHEHARYMSRSVIRSHPRTPSSHTSFCSPRSARSFRASCHTLSTIMKLKLIKKLAIDTIGPAGVSIQHVISLDVRGDAKDLLCAGACTRGLPTLNQEYSCKWHSSTVARNYLSPRATKYRPSLATLLHTRVTASRSHRYIHR